MAACTLSPDPFASYAVELQTGAGIADLRGAGGSRLGTAYRVSAYGDTCWDLLGVALIMTVINPRDFLPCCRVYSELEASNPPSARQNCRGTSPCPGLPAWLPWVSRREPGSTAGTEVLSCLSPLFSVQKRSTFLFTKNKNKKPQNLVQLVSEK